MIKKFSELEEGDCFLFLDAKGKKHLFQVLTRINESMIRAVKANLPFKDYLFGKSWHVDCHPNKLTSVFARRDG